LLHLYSCAQVQWNDTILKTTIHPARVTCFLRTGVHGSRKALPPISDFQLVNSLLCRALQQRLYRCTVKTSKTLLHYWLNRGKWFSIIRLCIVTILLCECVLCIVMRPKNCHLCITFFLDTRAVLRLKGPFGQVLQGYLQSNYLCWVYWFLFLCVLPSIL